MNCDGIARWYRWLEYFGFGRELERRRFHFLAGLGDAKRVLALGEGDGRFLARLAEQNPGAAIDCVDASARMLALARGRTLGSHVNFQLADIRLMPLPCSEYDLVVTHFLLDCFEEADLRAVAARVAAAAQPGARWVVSEFRQPANGWRAAWARSWLVLLYWFFRATTGLTTRALVDHHPILESFGFRLERQRTSRFGLLTSELWQR
ncbi:MAG: class I SAM-dependent methyltransferase [Bryobacteraceae bacterium]